jgi:general secretion pathway protein H
VFCGAVNHKQSSANGGFTLLELMVVMVLISLMTAIAMPGLRSTLFSDQLKSSTRKILGLVSEASQEAVRRQSGYSLQFNLDQNSVSASQGQSEEKSDGQQAEKEKESALPDSVRVVDIISVHGGIQSEGKAVIRFSGKGYVDKTLIHLRADDGRDMTIMLSPFLGVTRVFDSYIDLEDDKVRY